ncbi:hypothetical protein [uncultured Methanoregula sp.]|uniref:hypothetical protein n=1 Tax=uncultured Methanoregula sp. TaxID=1005933 RepID=UPI003748C185
MSIRFITWSSPVPSFFAIHQTHRSGIVQTREFRSFVTVVCVIGSWKFEVADFRISWMPSES